MDNKLKSLITWNEIGKMPDRDGMYYVMGDGITGAVPMKLINGKWEAPDGADPWLFGTLKSDKYSYIKTSGSKITGLTAAQKKRAHIDNVHQIMHMIGERKDNDTDEGIVDVILYNDGHLEYFWRDVDSVKDDVVMYFFETLENALTNKLNEKKKTVASTKKAETPEPVKSTQNEVKSETKTETAVPQDEKKPDQNTNTPPVKSDPLPDELEDANPVEEEPDLDELPF